MNEWNSQEHSCCSTKLRDMTDEPAGVSSLPAELTDMADEPIGASSLPTELLTHTLANTPPDSICAASAVSRHWQSGAEAGLGQPRRL